MPFDSATLPLRPMSSAPLDRPISLTWAWGGGNGTGSGEMIWDAYYLCWVPAEWQGGAYGLAAKDALGWREIARDQLVAATGEVA